MDEFIDEKKNSLQVGRGETYLKKKNALGGVAGVWQKEENLINSRALWHVTTL